MSWSLEYSDTDRILTVKCEGSFTADDLAPMTQAAVEKLREEHSLRVLLDFSAALAQVTITEMFKLPEIYTELRAPRLAHLAMVVPASGYRKDVYQFYEDLSVNRGYFVKLFKSISSAKAWLMQADAEQPHT